MKQVQSRGLDVTSRAGIWALFQVYLWLLFIRDEAGFVVAFSLVVEPKSWGGECTFWTKSSTEVSAIATWEPAVGEEDDFLRALLPSNGSPWEGNKCHKLWGGLQGMGVDKLWYSLFLLPL